MPKRKFRDLEEFYPVYLQAHRRCRTKIFHFTGTFLGMITAIVGLAVQSLLLFLAGFGIGYLFAWISHFFVEGNTPETLRHPVLSFRADIRMFFELLFGKRKFKTD